jgi:hypothetical protein
MTETYFRDVTDIGTLQRTARQHKVLIDRRQLDVAYWKDKVATQAGWQAQADKTDKTDTTGGAKLEEILDKRTTEEGGLEYQVKWAGTEERSWEPVGNLAGTMALVVEHEVALDAGMNRSSSGGQQGDQMVGALVTIMDSQVKLAEALGRLEQSRRTEKTKAADEKTDTRMAWDRPVLKGDERRKKVGRDMFDKERGLRRMRKLAEMDMHKPFCGPV